jgi:hypothetical protein
MKPPSDIALSPGDWYEVVTTHPLIAGRVVAVFCGVDRGDPVFDINGTDYTIPWEAITSIKFKRKG